MKDAHYKIINSERECTEFSLSFRPEIILVERSIVLTVLLRLAWFFYLVCEAIGTAATPGLLCQPRVIVKMIVEKQMAGEIEVLGENLPQRHFVHHIFHMTRPGFEPGQPQWEASD
jgi:hypothetical protein